MSLGYYYHPEEFYKQVRIFKNGQLVKTVKVLKHYMSTYFICFLYPDSPYTLEFVRPPNDQTVTVSPSHVGEYIFN